MPPIIIISTICPHVGMNQFGQMGMQSMGQGPAPSLPLNPSGNQVGICCHVSCYRLLYVLKDELHLKIILLQLTNPLKDFYQINNPS